MKRKTSDGLEVWDEAQYLLDGLTIKHVHDETGTLAFLIQHCYGLRGPRRRMNALEAKIRSKQWKKFIEKLSIKYSKKKSHQTRRPGMQTPGLDLAKEIWRRNFITQKGIAFLQKKEYFLLLLNYCAAGTPSLRKFLKARLDRFKESRLSIKERVRVRESLSREEQAKYYSAWYYAAIHVMLTISRFQTKEAIAAYLKISPKLVTETLDFLISVDLATKSGNKFVTGSAKIHLEKDSPLISKHHANWRMAAIRSFENEDADNLHFSSVFTLTEKDADQIRNVLLKTIENSVSVIKEAKEEITMAMTMDFFKL